MADGLVLRKQMVGRARNAISEPEALDEHELVRRAQQGDAAAFGVLVVRHQDTIYRLAVRTAGYDAAEDLAQNAFLKAWDALPGFAGDAAFGTWLYRIALNGCYDHLRRRARHRQQPLDAATLEIPDAGDLAEGIVAAAEEEERRVAIAAALAALPADDRALLALRIGEEWSYERIAAELQLNIKTVGTRLFRARAKLHRLVSQQLRERRGDGS